VRVRIQPIVDSRTPAMRDQHRALEQERADLMLEAAWRSRVAENVRRRMSAKADAMIHNKET
jgi:hypothetical protein